MEVARCLQRTDGIKYVIIKKASDIIKGDNVAIIKLSEKEVRENARKREGRS
jgi:hypothetical protein